MGMGHSYKDSYDPSYCPDEMCLHDYEETVKERDELRSQLKDAEEVIRLVWKADVFAYACDNRGYDCEEDAESDLCRGCKKEEAYRKKWGDGDD